MTKPTQTRGNLLKDFLGEYVILFITGLNTTIQAEDGNVADIPMVAEGILYDYDDRYVLIGSEDKTVFSLINHDNIGKLDSGDAPQPISKPDVGSMN